MLEYIVYVSSNSNRKRFSWSNRVTAVCETHRCLLKTVKLNRLMNVIVWSSSDEDETRHVYSPASSSETSDKIKDQAHAYLNRLFSYLVVKVFIYLKHNKKKRIQWNKFVTYVCSSINRVCSPLAVSLSSFAINKRPVGP